MKNNLKNKIDYELTEFSKYSSVINDFEAIDTKADWEIVKKKIESKEKVVSINNNTKTKNLIFKIAAVSILVIGLGIVFKNYQEFWTSSGMIAVQTKLEKKELILPDNSKVFLNINSELTYPEEFKEDSRIVGLKGEAFFEVERNKSKPFIIEIGKVSTKVLGTSFTINAYDEKVKINVISGKVEFFNTNKPSSKVILTKNQKAEFVSGNIIKKENTDPNFLSWKTGVLTFKNTPLKKVFLTLENHFNKKITIDLELEPSSTLTSTFDNEKLEDVLKEITMVADLYYKVEKDTVYISNESK